MRAANSPSSPVSPNATIASYARATSHAVVSSGCIPMSKAARNRVFFPQACLDHWSVEGKIELTPTELVLLAEGRRYAITEVVYVVVEVTGANDPYAIVGKVKSKAELEGVGAEILENSMIIGDNAYDVVPGWAGTPMTSFSDTLAAPERKAALGGRTEAGGSPKNDEDMLGRFGEGAL